MKPSSTILIFSFAAALISGSYAVEPESTPPQDNPIASIEDILADRAVIIEGRIERSMGEMFFMAYDQTSQPPKKYLLLPGTEAARLMEPGELSISCKVKLNEARTAISSLVVIDFRPIGAKRKEIDGLIVAFASLADVVLSDEGDEKILSQIKAVKAMIIAQSSFYKRYYPREFSRLTEEAKEPAPNPFQIEN
jgi:hypothetical protein